MREVLTGVGLGLAVFTVYTLTSYPTVPGGDAGELIVAAHRLGVAHPPGYPTFTMLGWLMSHVIPFGSVAWRINMSSAIYSSGATVFLYHSVILFLKMIYADDKQAERSRTAKPTKPAASKSAKLAATVDTTSVGPSATSTSDMYIICAVVAASLYAFSPLIWLYATHAEVFSLNNLFICGLIFLTLKFASAPTPTTAFVGAFWCGLSLTNQHTSIFFILPIVLWVLFVGRRFLLPYRIPHLIVCFGLGLIPYLYLFVAARNAPPGSWGDTSNWEGFVHHFLRREYGTFRLYSGDDGTSNQLALALWYFANDIVSQQALFVGGPIGLLGVVVSFKADMRSSAAVSLLILTMFSFYMIVFHILANLPLTKALFFGIHKRFWMQPCSCVFLWIGVGLKSALETVGRLNNQLTMLVATALIASQVGRHYRLMDMSTNTAVFDYGKMVLDHLPNNTLLVVKGDLITNSVRYLQTCEGYREDVVHMDQSMMTYEWYKITQEKHLRVKFPKPVYHPYKPEGYSFFEFLKKNWKNQPTFLCGGYYHDEPKVLEKYKLWPHGFCDQIVDPKKGTPLDRFKGSSLAWYDWTKSLLPEWAPPDMRKFTDDSWEAVVYSDYWQCTHKFLFHLLEIAISKNNDQELMRVCAREYDNLVLRHPNPPEYFYKNQGVSWGRVHDPAARPKYQQAFKMYLKVAPKGVISAEERKNLEEIIRGGAV